MAFMSPVSRGFHRRRQDSAENAGRVPPGQYVTKDFPVLSAGPTPHAPLDGWSFSIGRRGRQKTWSWAEFRDLPSENVTVDIHCVTKWTKLDTAWQGVSVDALLDLAGHDAPFAMAHCDGGYTTNVPVADLTGGKAWVAYAYDGQPHRRAAGRGRPRAAGADRPLLRLGPRERRAAAAAGRRVGDRAAAVDPAASRTHRQRGSGPAAVFIPHA